MTFAKRGLPNAYLISKKSQCSLFRIVVCFVLKLMKSLQCELSLQMTYLNLITSLGPHGSITMVSIKGMEEEIG